MQNSARPYNKRHLTFQMFSLYLTILATSKKGDGLSENKMPKPAVICSDCVPYAKAKHFVFDVKDLKLVPHCVGFLVHLPPSHPQPFHCHHLLQYYLAHYLYSAQILLQLRRLAIRRKRLQCQQCTHYVSIHLEFGWFCFLSLLECLGHYLYAHLSLVDFELEEIQRSA